jgi:YqfQ-like protein
MLFQKQRVPNYQSFQHNSPPPMMGHGFPPPTPPSARMHHAPPFQQTMHTQHPMGQRFPTSGMMGMQQPRGGNPPPNGMRNNKGLGGIFSNLFSKSRGPNTGGAASQAITRAAGASASANASSGVGNIFSKLFSGVNGTGIANTLGNVQKMTQMAGTVIPTVQQYGPMVKNLPSLLKIFKEVNSDDGTTEKKSTTAAITQATTQTTTQENVQPTISSGPQKTEQGGKSNPKMYI